MGAQERYVGPAQLPCCHGGEGGGDFRRGRENGADYVFRGDLVEADDGVEQVSRRLEDVLGGIGLDRRRAADPATGDVSVAGGCWLRHGISLGVMPIRFSNGGGCALSGYLSWERRLAAQTAPELLRRYALVGVRDGVEEVDQRRSDDGAVRHLTHVANMLG